VTNPEAERVIDAVYGVTYVPLALLSAFLFAPIVLLAMGVERLREMVR